MKRAREPLGYLASLNQDLQKSAPTDAQGKRVRPKHQRAFSTSNGDIGGSLHGEHDIDLEPFRGLLAAGGIIWTSEHEARGGDVAMDGRKEQGYACRCNPSKLRLAVEKALVHDPARQREFVEVRAATEKTSNFNEKCCCFCCLYVLIVVKHSRVLKEKSERI